MMSSKYIIVVFVLLLTLSVKAQKERKHIRQGNRSYENAVIDSVTIDSAMYQEAEVDYRKALEKDPNNWDASYNLANSLYKQGKYEDATKQFQAVSAMESGDKNKTAQAYHNLGNSYLQASKLDEAIEAYKNALRNNPSDLETKYNLAWAKNQKKQQQQQDQQNQDQNKDQENEDQEKDDQQKQDQEQQQDKQDQKDKQDQQQQKDQQQQDQQQTQPQEPKDQISKEDAMRILQALENDEKEVQDKVQKLKAQPKKRNTQKDW